MVTGASVLRDVVYIQLSIPHNAEKFGLKNGLKNRQIPKTGRKNIILRKYINSKEGGV
jgi:hypothetical protein